MSLCAEVAQLCTTVHCSAARGHDGLMTQRRPKRLWLEYIDSTCFRVETRPMLFIPLCLCFQFVGNTNITRSRLSGVCARKFTLIYRRIYSMVHQSGVYTRAERTVDFFWNSFSAHNRTDQKQADTVLKAGLMVSTNQHVVNVKWRNHNTNPSYKKEFSNVVLSLCL